MSEAYACLPTHLALMLQLLAGRLPQAGEETSLALLMMVARPVQDHNSSLSYRLRSLVRPLTTLSTSAQALAPHCSLLCGALL